MKFSFFLVSIIIISILFAGCIQASDREQFRPSEPGTIPHFTEFWNNALNLSGIQNDSACFEDISVHMDGNRTIDNLYMDFSGVKQQQRNLYRLDLNPARGTVILSSRGVDQEQREIPGTHPLIILTALEQFPYSSFDPGLNPLNIRIMRYENPGIYDDTCYDIYEIDNGTIIPLKTIDFCPPVHDYYPIVVSPDMQSNTGARFSTNSDRSHVILTADDIAKAGTVIYKKTGSTPGIRNDRIGCPVSESGPAGCGGGSGGGGGGAGRGGEGGPVPDWTPFIPNPHFSEANLKSIDISAEKQGQNIIITNGGGPDAPEVTSFVVTIDGGAPINASKLGTTVGSSQSFAGTRGKKNDVRVNATFKDGSRQPILDTAV